MTERDKRKKSLGEKIRKQYHVTMRNKIVSGIFATLTLAALVLIVLLEIMPSTYAFTVGEAAAETVYAIADVEDPAATEEAKLKARAAVAAVYKIDESLTRDAMDFFENTVFAGFYKVASYGAQVRGQSANEAGYQIAYDTATVASYKANDLAFLKGSDGSVADAKVQCLLETDPEDVENLKEWILPQVRALLNGGLREEGLEEAKATLIAAVGESRVTADAELKQILNEVVQDDLTANDVVDEEATEKARQAAADAVTPVYLEKGTLIVAKDEIVTQNQYDMIKKLGLLDDGRIPQRLMFGTAALVALLVLAVMFYIVLFERKEIAKTKKILLLCLLVVLNVVIALLFKSLGGDALMNTAMSVILITVFFGEHLALVVNAALSVLLAMIFSGKSDLFGGEAVALMISTCLGGMAAVLFCRHFRSASRSKMLLAGLAAGAVGMIAHFIMLWLVGKSAYSAALPSLYCLAGGAIAALASTGSLPVWESMFNLLTQSKLLELSNSGSDLLRKISVEIPGTYQHSATVAEMAENAAKDIGANALLARTAALYHDIGKVRMPECYIENQTAESQGFHSTLSPWESTEMIFSHITEGVRMAKENKLPQEIIDVIRQHHGTSPVLYFYQKAKELDPEAKIDDFRYPGPNPQTKEAAIILLADCIEASVRSMDEKDGPSIAAQIEKMVKTRMEDGELDECDMSLKELNTIKHSFAATLAAVYHARIKYDSQEEKHEDRDH